MSWFAVALLGYAALAVTFVLDKFILTESVSQPVVYTFYSTIFMLGALLAVPFGVELLVGWEWAIAIASGLGFGFGLWFMFIGVKSGEASHVNPFVGAVTTVGTFGLAAAFLGESLTSGQQLGTLILCIAVFLLSFFTEQGKLAIQSSFGWGVLAGLAFAISHVAAKYLYEVYPFLTGFVWTRATIGLVGIFCLFFPAVWRSFQKKEVATTQQPALQFGKRYAIAIVVSNKVLGVVGTVLIQVAIAIGSVTLVNALVGLQYAFMFVIIYLFSRFAPQLFKERFTRFELITETLAILLVVVGAGLFVL